MRKKALVIVDVQSAFLREKNQYIINNILALIHGAPYDFFVDSVFFVEKDSLWDKQTQWYLPKDKSTKTVDEIRSVLANKPFVHIEKDTKSTFKGTPNLHDVLRKQNIKEVHIAGLDANDCVLATAYEAFDLGYFTYVIEECTDSSNTTTIRDTGLAVLRHVHLTNHAVVEKTNFLNI